MNIETARLKVDLASANLRVTGLEHTLRDMREQLIKARDALGRGHDLEVECCRHIARAWHILNFDCEVQGSALPQAQRGSEP